MALARGCLVGVLLVAFAHPLAAQEPKSAALAKQLTAAMDQAKLDTIAAKDPAAGADMFVAAMHIGGSQLLIVSGKYAAPQLLEAAIAKRDYREVYGDLHGASVAGSKVFIEDTDPDGLFAKQDGGPDSIEIAGKRVVFDGDWKKQKLTEDEYRKAYADAESRYVQMLTALLAQAKRTS